MQESTKSSRVRKQGFSKRRSFNVLNLSTIATVGSILLLLYFSQLTYERIRQPFIDEYFHYEQLVHYLEGNWLHWDPLITTPPGLYYLTWAYIQVVNWLGFCLGSVFAIDAKYFTVLNQARSFNFLGGLVIVYCCHQIKAEVWPASMLLNPLLVIYYSLYYTDVWSAVMVMIMYTLATKKVNASAPEAWLAAIVGFASLWLRQTNIVWCMYCLACMVDQRRASKGNVIFQFIVSALRNWALVLPFGVLAGVFVWFVRWNGGITLGDKQNHQVVLHLVQMCYCCTFMSVFLLPIWISKRFIKGYLKDIFRSWPRFLINVLWLAVICFIVDKFTIVHPFLLADNRHYTFYIMRKIINRGPMWKYSLVPIYHFSFYTIYHCFDQSRVIFLAWLVCTTASIVPSPLFEPRYYIIPYLTFRLGCKCRGHRLLSEWVWLALWTVGLYYVMLHFEFEWANLPEKQRVIW